MNPEICAEESSSVIQFDGVERKRVDIEGNTARVKRWVFEGTGGRCEVGKDLTVNLYDNGTFRVSGEMRCNAGNIQSCKFGISVQFYTIGANGVDCAGCIQISSTAVINNVVIGPRSSYNFEVDYFDQRLKAEYDNIRCANYTRLACEVGI